MSMLCVDIFECTLRVAATPPRPVIIITNMAAHRETPHDTPTTTTIKKTTFEGWKYAHYFDFVTRDDRNIKVKCKLCPGQKILSSAFNTTSNLIKHLNKKHKNTKLVAARDAQSRTEVPDDDGPTPSKQQKLDFEKPKEISKSEVNRLSASYIVEEMLPLSTVESSFRKLVGKINIIGICISGDYME